MRHARPVQVSFQRVVPLAMLAIAGVSVPWMLRSPSGVPRLRALALEREALGREIQRLSRDIERLRYKARDIKSSPSSVERVARDDLGLVRRTEFVVHFESE